MNWYKIKDKEPTEDDADSDGNVIVGEYIGNHRFVIETRPWKNYPWSNRWDFWAPVNRPVR